MSEGISSDQTFYIERDRRRTEISELDGRRETMDGPTDVHYGPRLASNTRCDLGQAFELNLDTGEYVQALILQSR